jgi:hypothetical protein
MRRLACLLLLAGCGPDPNTDLASLQDRYDLRLSLQADAAGDADPTVGSVGIGYDEEHFAFDHDGDCAVLGGDLGGSIGDTELNLNVRGDRDDEFGDCHPARLSFSTRFSSDQPTVLTVADDTATVTAVFAAGALAPHHPILRSHSEWVFRGGEQVRIGWSHPEDLTAITWDEYTVYVRMGELDESINRSNSFTLAVSVVGDEIQFTMPSPPPLTGRGRLAFDFAWTGGDAVTCEATACTFNLARRYHQSVTISD